MREIISPLDGIRSPFGPRRGGAGPALYLPFALTGTLDPRITFSRPSLATMYDSTGKLTYAPNNLVLQSNALGTSPWVMSNTGVGVVPTPTNAYATYNGRNQTRLQFSLGGGTATGDISTAYQALTYVGTTIHSVMLCSTDGVSSYNMQITGGDGTAQNIVVTGTPTQFFVKQTATGTVNYAVRLRGGQVPANSNTADILVWDDQIEAVTYETTPRTFNATTSAAYYGPRFDYNPATLVARGLLIEEARTNRVVQSAMGTSLGSWSGNLSTRTLSAEVTPDGTVSAMQIVTTGNAGLNLSQVITTVVGQTYTASMWLKGVSGQQIYFLAMDSAAGQELITFTGSWQRVTKVFTATATTSFIGCELFNRSGGASLPNVTFNAWGAQYELGAFATSYIPTAATAVARSADSASMTGTNFSSWYNQAQGTFVVAADVFGAIGGELPTFVNVNDTTTSNYIRLNAASTYRLRQFINVGGSQQTQDVTGSAPVLNQQFKVGAAYNLNDFAVVADGGAVSTDATGTVPTVTQINFGVWFGSAGTFLNGHIASITYYNTRLPNDTLQSLTLPVIADYYFLVDANGDQITDASGNPLYTQPLYL